MKYNLIELLERHSKQNKDFVVDFKDVSRTLIKLIFIESENFEYKVRSLTDLKFCIIKGLSCVRFTLNGYCPCGNRCYYEENNFEIYDATEIEISKSILKNW